MTLSIRIVPMGVLTVFLTAFGCGSKDKSKSSDPDPEIAVGSGKQISFASGSDATTLTIEGVEADHEYILLPMVLGKFGDIAGAGVEIFGFGFKASTALANGHASSTQAFDVSHTRRTFLNRFRAGQWSLQEPGAKAAAKTLDAIDEDGMLMALESDGPLTRMLRKGARIESSLTISREQIRNSATDCPTETVSVPRWKNSTTMEILDLGIETSYDGGTFCLIVVDGSTPVSEPDLDAIKKSVSTALKTYAQAIYEDQFTTNKKDGYEFKPHIVIVDFADASIWPDPNVADPDLKAINTVYQVAGAFFSDMTTVVKRPVLYFAADLSTVQGFAGISADNAKRTFHATVAHELQHAIIDYYRSRGETDKPETVAVDEGIAHFMEDLFGYGDMTFDGFAKTFLATLSDGTSPFLGSGEDSKVVRGAAQSLIYYLVSRQGGVEFDASGMPRSSSGLKAIAKLAKNSSKSGAPSLADAFGYTDASSWAKVLGQFVGALVLDGSTVADVASEFTTQVPIATRADLQGNSGKTYGMRFNGFGGLTDRLLTYQKTSDASVAGASFELHHYHSVPVRWIPGAGAKQLQVNMTVAEERYLQIVRIK